MDAAALQIRPLPQAPPPKSGAASASKPEVSHHKAYDAPAFAPADRETPPAATASTDKRSDPPAKPSSDKPAERPSDNRAAKTSDTSTQTADANPSEPDATTQADAAASSNPAAGKRHPATVADGNALLIAQAASTPTVPAAATAAVVPPQPAPNVPNRSDTATAVQAAVAQLHEATTAQAHEAAVAQLREAATAQARGAAAAQPTPDAPAQVPIDPSAARAAQTDARGKPGAPQTATVLSQLVPEASSDATKPSSNGPDGAAAAKPNALNTLLESAKPSGPPQAASQNPASATATQNVGAQAGQVAQVAVAIRPDAALPTADKHDAATPPPAHATADAPTAPMLAFGTDPGASAHVKMATAAYEAARAAVPVLPASEQMAMQIHRAVEDGIDKLTVELKPASLGRVSAEIQFHNDQRVHVVLSADRAATLDALRSDSRALERALQDAGLRADAGSLSFQFENGGNQSGFTPDSTPSEIVVPAAHAAQDIAPLAHVAYAAMSRPGGVDIRV